jgi:uronate dehydrogenase
MIFERVLLTGAAGKVGSCLRAGLRDDLRELRLSDLAPISPEAPSETDAPADLRDFAAVCRAVDGVEAVVHLGGVPVERPFEEIAGPNLHGVFHVFEAARRAGVRRVVFASSNHATGFYPTSQRLTGTEPVRPDGLYGASKAYGEALGRMYADRFGLEVISVRIGSMTGGEPTEPRQLCTWLSPGDAVRLFAACLTARDVGYAVVYGASANTRGWWDLGPARALGYEPRDNAEDYAAQVGEGDAGEPQGGPFAARDSGGWVV